MRTPTYLLGSFAIIAMSLTMPLAVKAASPEREAEKPVETVPQPIEDVGNPVSAGALGSAAPMLAPPVSTVNVVPVKVIYVSENQPVQIVDQMGRLIQVIYLRKR